MALSRRNYEAIAALIDSLRGDYDDATLEVVASGLCGVFAADNPYFKRDKFLEACGIEP